MLIRGGDFRADQHSVYQLAGHLRKRPEATAREFLAIAAGERLNATDRTRMQLVMLAPTQPRAGYSEDDDALFASIWQTFPALAFAIDPSMRRGAAHCERFLDHSGAENAHEIPELARVEQLWLQLAEDALRTISTTAGIRGRPRVLGEAGLQMAHYEWLLAGAEGTVNLSDWWRRNSNQPRQAASDAIVSKALAARTSEGAEAHADLPLASLRSAAHLLTAEHPEPQIFLFELARFAPRLVELDLILAFLHIQK